MPAGHRKHLQTQERIQDSSHIFEEGEHFEPSAVELGILRYVPAGREHSKMDFFRSLARLQPQALYMLRKLLDETFNAPPGVCRLCLLLGFNH